MRTLVRFASLLLLSASSFLVLAYQVQPMISELETSGNNASITYRVVNPSDTTLPIEVEVFKREFDENMKEVLVPNDEDFIVLPPQIEVAANGYQVFRAQYIGNTEFDSTQSYRIVFKQLPIETGQQTSQVNMVFNFATLVFVSTPGSEKVLTQQVKCDENDECYLHVENTGSKVANMVQSSIQVDGEPTADWQWLQKQLPVTFLMPGHSVSVPLKEIATEAATQKIEMVPATANQG